MTTLFHHVIETSVEDAIVILKNILERAGEDMKIVKTHRNHKKNGNTNKEWWDEVCEKIKINKRFQLMKFRETNAKPDLERYLDVKREFKTTCREKMLNWKAYMKEELMKLRNNPNQFWKQIKSLGGRTNASSRIASDVWIKHFRDLLCSQPTILPVFKEGVEQTLSFHDEQCEKCCDDFGNNLDIDTDLIALNSSLTEEEVSSSINEMSNGKAPGTDGIVVEMIKADRILFVPLLTKLFNKIFDTGIYPTEWAEAMICPIYKKGSRDNPTNYRGISLLNVISKIFTKTLNNRLGNWANENDVHHEEQAGFRHGYSTVDQMFVLQSLVQKYLCRKKGRLYVMFIDFTTAFDTVPHFLLWYRLIKLGIHGKVIRILRSMYLNLKANIRLFDGATNFFHFTAGLRQGCMLSPLLFVLFIGEFVDMLHQAGCTGIYINEQAPNIMILLFADDVALCGDSIGRLNEMIKTLENYTEKWGMKVNMDKTKIIVFRRGGKLKKNETFSFMKHKIDIVNEYKYLGIFFTTKLKWSKATTTLAQQASKALHMLYIYERKCDGLPLLSAFELFDKMILPVLLYGAEIWGYKEWPVIEKVHLKFLKRLVGVSQSTSNAAIYGETGRLPLAVHYQKRCIKYWMKLKTMNDTRYPKQCYYQLKEQSDAGRLNWATDIKNLLMTLNLSDHWEKIRIENEQEFLGLVDRELVEHYKNQWMTQLQGSSKLTVYRTIKDTSSMESYLCNIRAVALRRILTKFRVSDHTLEIERGRRENVLMEDRLCTLCKRNNKLVLEDEYHFMIHCPVYEELRSKYLPSIVNNENRDFELFINTMKTNDTEEQIRIAIYLWKSFKKREILIQEGNGL